ncbi:MAG: 4'-phosphopantetheinyl transferase superfamily protein [Sandaracinaceae bacterium]|nr:4'-phosphopantetheinyl transferase superfamily protein [Sandaracinaceae bacterium]
MTPDLSHEIFAGLFPPSVVVRSRDPRISHAEGPPEEEAQIARAVTKRKNEFRAGRRCAHEALRAIKSDQPLLLTGPDREPLWPKGVVGSISHSSVLCVAAVALGGDLRGLGVDTEIDEVLPAALIPKVCTEREAARGLHKQVFSAKEATYKCLHPIVKKFFGFHAAEIEFDAGTFTVTLLIDLPPFTKGARFAGRHRTQDGLIATALIVPF